MERLRALLVEDDEDDCLLVLRELARGGYEVSWERVETAEAMAAALDRAAWDLIVSDFRLPRFSAPEVLELYRRRGLDIPLIIVSGTIGEEQAVESLKAGAHDFLLKDRLARLCPAVARELRESEVRRARHRAEERYRVLVEQIPAVLYIAAPDGLGDVLYVSPQIENLFGFPARDWTAQPELWRRQTHPADRERVAAEFLALRQRGGDAAHTAEYRMLARDGRTLWVRDEARLVRAGERTVARVQGLLQDVTDLRRAQELNARQREALHQTEKVAAMGQLLAGVAHELNNPLSVVLGQASLLRRTLAGRPEQVRVERMEQAAARCARIVKSFLALARQQPPSRAAVAVDGLIGEVVELLVYPLRVDDIDLRVEVAPDLPELWADGHQIQQLLINLLSNAHHELKRSAAPRRLTLAGSYDAATREIAIDVVDNGPGIHPDVLSRLFEPFFTTKPVGEGTGLGLSLCRGIAEGHGGTIQVESEPGRGARFQVRLPVRSAAELGLPASGGVRELRRNSAHILVVDDEASVAELVADIAAAEGHRVKTAGDGAAALRLLEAARFDLVLADIRMPGLSGPELYRHAVERWPELERRFVFLTGDTLAPDTWAFLSEEGRPHLAKPFSADDLSRVLNEGLGGDR